MGCNCGKKKRRTQASTRPKPTPKESTPQGKTQAFTLTTNTGRTLRFGSELEANAENVRVYGGQGTVRQV